MLPIREVTAKNARSKRYLARKAPQQVEHARTTLFLKYTTTSEVVNLVLKDLYALKRPRCMRFEKKNDIRPFEDTSSLDFFANKNDASLMAFASHSKKRPHAVTLIRFFDFQTLDMLELLVEPETYRSLSQFKNDKKALVGLKPLLTFSGSAFDSPVPNAYTLAKSIFLDLFKGPDVDNVDVQGLQYMVHISVDEPASESAKPVIHLRCYLIKTKKSSGSVPKVIVEEMGPRIDFRVGRSRDADPDMWKEAMRKPRSLEPKTKKNVETDIVGDKVGRIHMGRQDLSQLQTRKMKGLKRSRDVVDDDFDDDQDNALESSTGGVSLELDKRPKLAT